MLDHADQRAAGGRYCVDKNDPVAQQCVDAGFMQKVIGPPAPNAEYFMLTSLGMKALILERLELFKPRLSAFEHLRVFLENGE